MAEVRDGRVVPVVEIGGCDDDGGEGGEEVVAIEIDVGVVGRVVVVDAAGGCSHGNC